MGLVNVVSVILASLVNICSDKKKVYYLRKRLSQTAKEKKARKKEKIKRQQSSVA